MGGFTVFLIGMNAYMFISMSFTAIPMVVSFARPQCISLSVPGRFSPSSSRCLVLCLQAWAQFLYWLAMFIYAAFVVYLAIGVSRYVYLLQSYAGMSLNECLYTSPMSIMPRPADAIGGQQHSLAR